MLLLSCLILSVLCWGCAAQTHFFVQVFENQTWSFDSSLYPIPFVFNTKDVVAIGALTKTDDLQGWPRLSVASNPSASPSLQAWAAGFAEGLLTADMVYIFYLNSIGAGYCADSPDICAKLFAFKADNDRFMKNMVSENPKDPYWVHVGLFLEQLEGTMRGVNSRGGHPLLSENELWMLVAWTDIGDIVQKWAPVDPEDPVGFGGADQDHCSGLVRWVPGVDLFFSQATWSGYTTMNRLWKTFNITLFPGLPGAFTSFSSYPGYSSTSSDDYYQIEPSGLVVMETTNSVYNKTLYHTFITSESVLEFVRVVVANRLATSGEHWAQLFSRYNSGTYNNGYYVVNLELFKDPKAGSLEPGTLVLLEQMPGLVLHKDITPLLTTQGYFSSYNIPHFDEIYKLSGYPEMKAKYPDISDFFSLTGCPRARIFAARAPKVTTLEDMMFLMRYNDFQHDPMSRCNGWPGYSGRLAIAARSDLDPANGTYSIPNLERRASGAIDAKIGSASMRTAGAWRTWAQHGPTYQGQPPFCWSTSGLDTRSHLDQPDCFEFEWVQVG
jgi:hypothetical protein